MKPTQAAARAAALLFALAVWSCDGSEPQQPASPDSGTPSTGRPDAGPTGGTVINAPDNQAQQYVSTDPRYSVTWTFELRNQVAIPPGVREVYVDRHSFGAGVAARGRAPETRR